MRIQGCETLIDFNSIMKNALKEEPLLVCYLDGLGWHGYKDGEEKGYIPFTSRNFLMAEMTTVEPPITNAAMATMITGVTPEIHKVTSRKNHKLAVKSIFADQPKGRKVAIVEGDSIILQTEIRPQLNVETAEKNIDQLVYENAVKNIEDGCEFLFVHFHGIDDMAHEFGPYSENAHKKMNEVDEYIEKLSNMWEGQVLLISDHGLHDNKNAKEGTHGIKDLGSDTYQEEDMKIIFGLGMNKGQMTVDKMARLLWGKDFDGNIIFCGEDGFASACSIDEAKENDQCIVELYENEARMPAWRFCVKNESYQRRWCKNIECIELQTK